MLADTKKKVLVEHERKKGAIAKNVRAIFDFFEFEAEIEHMREANQLAIGRLKPRPKWINVTKYSLVPLLQISRKSVAASFKH